MRQLALAILLLLLASPARGTSYFLATATGGGSDSNDGRSPRTPWLSPNHAVNCGDVITAAPSTSYSAADFASGKWGTVTCSAGNNVAWLKCATFDACKISSPGDAMKVSASYWGIEGWENTSTARGACFAVAPPTTSATIHHIIFANDIANGCYQGGFNAFNNRTAGVDYLAYVGDIAYNAAQGSAECFEGFAIYSPTNGDTKAGTHIYWADNFAWNNVDANPCNGAVSTDGEGFILDTLDGNAYRGQIVLEDDISVFNGGRGMETLLNDRATPNAQIYLLHNTVYGNNTQTAQKTHFSCAEMFIGETHSIRAAFNLVMPTSATACRGTALYAYQVNDVNSTALVYDNFGYSAAGNNARLGGSNAGFAFGPGNTFGINPSFSNPRDPGPPNCGNYASVPACMANVIADFMPTTAAAAGYGYQKPSTGQTYDPLFPRWLCNVNLPAGLVRMRCLAGPSLSTSAALAGVKIQ